MRGMTEISFKTISLEGKELSFTKNLKKILNSNKVAIVLPSENPELRVELIGEESEKRILSLSGQGLVREYEISIEFVTELRPQKA
jgi:LPS-assembly lipoprotein